MINCRSIRKTYLNPLLGIVLDSLEIDLNTTLEDLKMEDNPALDHSEKQTTLRELLTSSSKQCVQILWVIVHFS